MLELIRDAVARRRAEVDTPPVGSAFLLAQRATMRAFQRVESNLAAANPYDQSAWAILYSALVKGYGVDPNNFQMTYPTIPWEWPTQSLGYIGPGQYDTLSTIPQWSAIGQYSSTGARFNDMYQAFLDVISPDTSDPDLRRQIDEAYNSLTDAANSYNRVVQQAKSAYNDDTDPDKPGFTSWLGTMSGKSWQTMISSAEVNLIQAQANYEAKVTEAKTPNLNAALEAYNNQDYRAKLNDPNLAGMPKVPNWSTPLSSQQWKDKAAAGDVPSSTIGFSNSDSAYDFKNTWAGGSAAVGNWFWAVKVSGSWQRIDSFQSDANLTASITFAGIELIAIQPSPWYMGVAPLARGPYKRGYSEYGGNDTQAAFGEDGFIPILKTGMYATYQPSFMITVNRSTFSAFSETFKAAMGLRIGPFEFEARGGSERAGWAASESGLSFTGTSTSRSPSIFGFSIQVLP